MTITDRCDSKKKSKRQQMDVNIEAVEAVINNTLSNTCDTVVHLINDSGL